MTVTDRLEDIAEDVVGLRTQVAALTERVKMLLVVGAILGALGTGQSVVQLTDAIGTVAPAVAEAPAVP